MTVDLLGWARGEVDAALTTADVATLVGASRRRIRGCGRVVYRCFNCKKFVRHRHATCRFCGNEHGGSYHHEAEPIT